MKYLVVVKYLPVGTDEWQVIYREFMDRDVAHKYALDEYERDARELFVSVYEMIENYN